MTETFSELGLNSQLVEGLVKAEITVPTEIQLQAIPLALENKEIIAQSETGSGKTLAYLLPIFEKIDLNGGIQSLILAPTHELASQIKRQVELLAINSGMPVSYALIIGEVNIKRQIEKLREKPHIVIGSTGRILELIDKKKITAHTVKIIVIDEADYLLNKKNIDTVRKIIKTTKKDRQILVFSASILSSTITIAKEFMRDPEIIKVESHNAVPINIKHSFYLTDYINKVEVLRKLVFLLKPEKSLVFVKQGDNIDDLTKQTKYHGKKAATLFGTMGKEERQKVLNDFRKGHIDILFATDIAARGLDVKGITHVFNLATLEDSKTYLHRCGRTGRQNSSGEAISIVTNDERELLEKFERELHITIEQKKL